MSKDTPTKSTTPRTEFVASWNEWKGAVCITFDDHQRELAVVKEELERLKIKIIPALENTIHLANEDANKLERELALANKAFENLTEMNLKQDRELAAAKEELETICGGVEQRVGGCGEVVLIKDAYRCTHCIAYFHRDCANQHFELDTYVKALRDKNNHAAIVDWKKSVEHAEQRLAEAEKVIDAAIVWSYCPSAGGYKDGRAIEDCCEELSEAVTNYLGVQLQSTPNNWWTEEEMRAAIAKEKK